MKGLYMMVKADELDEMEKMGKGVILRAFCKHSIRRRIRRRINKDSGSATTRYIKRELSHSAHDLLRTTPATPSSHEQHRPTHHLA
jgi:hypothetical protein